MLLTLGMIRSLRDLTLWAVVTHAPTFSLHMLRVFGRRTPRLRRPGVQINLSDETNKKEPQKGPILFVWRRARPLRTSLCSRGICLRIHALQDFHPKGFSCQHTAENKNGPEWDRLHFGGEGGIRTHGRSPFAGFQDRCFRPAQPPLQKFQLVCILPAVF